MKNKDKEERPNKIIITEDDQDDREDKAQRGLGKATLLSDGECQDTPVPNSRIKVKQNVLYHKKSIFKSLPKVTIEKVEKQGNKMRPPEHNSVVKLSMGFRI